MPEAAGGGAFSPLPFQGVHPMLMPYIANPWGMQMPPGLQYPPQLLAPGAFPQGGGEGALANAGASPAPPPPNLLQQMMMAQGMPPWLPPMQTLGAMPQASAA